MRNDDVVQLYERLGRTPRVSALVLSGRYPITGRRYGRRLGEDIACKLALRQGNRVLDLGCNVGLYHDVLARRASYVLGVDASEVIVERARARHSSPNLEYRAFDITDTWPELGERFDRILIYSVVHFLDGYEQLEQLLSRAAQQLGEGGRALLGEVRVAEKHETFLAARSRTRVPTARDLQFALNRRLVRKYVGETPSRPPLTFTTSQIDRASAAAGLRAVELDQQPFHPFYNTCSDFLLLPGR
jgi:2-polyprenyl-3-methyl-5-hydroxy-6-metoxy-1,4-benzoquinol methylase